MWAFVDLLPSYTSTSSPDTATIGYGQGEEDASNAAAATGGTSSSSSRGVIHRSRRRLDQENGIDYSSGERSDVKDLSHVDDDDEEDVASRAQQRAATETVCSQVGECSVCPHNWRVMIEKEEENVEGEWESCKRYGRRIKRQCNVLFRGELIAYSHGSLEIVRPNARDR